jgi:hypothetical protein
LDKSDHNYCLINGWADRTLGRLGLFRGLEWVIAEPEGDDGAVDAVLEQLHGRGVPEHVG